MVAFTRDHQLRTLQVFACFLAQLMASVLRKGGGELRCGQGSEPTALETVADTRRLKNRSERSDPRRLQNGSERSETRRLLNGSERSDTRVKDVTPEGSKTAKFQRAIFNRCSLQTFRKMVCIKNSVQTYNKRTRVWNRCRWNIPSTYTTSVGRKGVPFSGECWTAHMGRVGRS